MSTAPESVGLPTRRSQHGRGRRSPFQRFIDGLKVVAAAFAGTVFVLSMLSFIPAQLVNLQPANLLFRDFESSVDWQLRSERTEDYVQRQLSDVFFGRAVAATTFDCVPEDSPFYRIIRDRHDYQGLTINTDCEPLDFSNVPADQIHPDLIVESFLAGRAYFGTVPGFSPSGDTAIMVRDKWNDYVLVNYDSLIHLGLLTEGDRAS